ncbi:MAG TPA: HAMP domain-containing sensor histidine kinase, partial [Thermoanaerobaculia bacterium]|nr:HAMP domain-containing sensor histidine kinase [Thermoanaerobaculia bacterium]
MLAPTSRDAALTRAVFDRAGIPCLCCGDLDEICAQAESGAGALLLPEEAIDQDRGSCLIEWLARQPTWSDLPVLVLARPGADSAAVAQVMDLLGNVTVVERPTRVVALVSAVRAALRARQRQLQIRDHLAERREADRRKDEFLAILGHELRNPLAPIRSGLDLLKMSAADTEVVDMMSGQVEHLVRLVDDLLDVSRILRGKVELRRRPVELSEVVRRAAEAARAMFEAEGQGFTVTLPDGPVGLDADPVRLSQVFTNLLTNAGKYTEPGGRIML